MEIVFAILVFVVIPVLSLAFGEDSRPGFDERQPLNGSRRYFGVLRLR